MIERTCLIAAHDPWFIQLLKIYSEECGFRVVQAFDGQEVFAKASQEDLAAILLQLDLPGVIKGRDVIGMLHDDARTEHVPVFVFSWQENNEEKITGATAVLTEPVTYEGFVNALQAAGLDLGKAGRLPHAENGHKARNGAHARRRIRK